MNEANRGKQQEARSTLACSRDLSAHDTAQGIAVRVANLGIRLPLGRGASRLWGKHHWALRGVNFEVQRGEAVGVLGRNGSGKSTLLRAIAGIIAPDEGAIGVAPDLSAAILSPGAGFQPHLTGRENLYNSALYQGYLPKTVASKFHDIVEFAGIGAWIEQPVATYSAGMRVRLGFSLALHLPTDILMIDETLSAGDAAFRAKAKQLIDQLISNDRTVILVSHNVETLRATCRRGVVLDRGRQITVCDIGEAIETNQSILLGHGTPLRAGGPSRSEVEAIAYELRLAQEQLVALQDEVTMRAQVVHCVTEDYIAALEQVAQFDDPFSGPGDCLARPSSEVAHATQTAEQAYTQILDKKAGRVQAIIEEERVTAKLADLRERIAVLQGQLKEP